MAPSPRGIWGAASVAFARTVLLQCLTAACAASTAAAVEDAADHPGLGAGGSRAAPARHGCSFSCLSGLETIWRDGTKLSREGCSCADRRPGPVGAFLDPGDTKDFVKLETAIVFTVSSRLS
mmetsp:Transcript_19688/g.47003  ORF Transcript_19688/g.47003 Transcript_19688/m.47003 type:complete len:122 (+) Transcript_19688:2301-2666(+)